MLKRKIEHNIRKFYQDVNPLATHIRINVYKKRAFLSSYSDNFHCFIKMRDLKRGMIRKHIFAKHANKTEFDNLVKIWNIYKSKGIIPNIPKPLNFFEDINILIMEYMEGDNCLVYLLKNLLPGIREVNRKKIEYKICLCARWLAEFNNLTCLKTIDNFDNEIMNASRQLSRLPQFSERQKQFLISEIREESRSNNVPVVLTNRDFSPRNIILCSKGDIKVVDWETILNKNIYYSISYFFANLESKSRYFVYSLEYIKKLEKIFWKEYKNRINFDINEKLFKVMRILYYIEYIYEYYTKTGVFEQWKRSTEPMDNFINFIIHNLLYEDLL